MIAHAHVTNVQFNEARHAIGIGYQYAGENYRVQANREIILSAGSIGSPQLLLLSGIGSKVMLDKLGVSFKIEFISVIGTGNITI